jgi:predicted nucleic acid-binding protein
MDKPKVYLDNCCYARPFDDLSQEKIKNEATAKMYIQSLIINKSVALYSSYILFYEINEIPFTSNREHIIDFVVKYASFYVSEKYLDRIEPLSIEIMETGVRRKDAIHLACGIIAECDYFITTDKRLTKYKTDKIRIVNPVEFAEKWREMI